ncbi:DEAD/DEAH box helicase [Xylocopilactobacillus apis]|uniref:DEAD-box ATP-dependent RNA helicase CshB n=1 Tax=Xylocopilactobacillus apis TaxID=2932183 RepID=A0AAU9DM95_9LACO|nr:DEAD/DEAH box helicase [Xylocopilactobacillus apis]BDR56749.1 DEAD-box ATP-dependent RNA helicase CshB [Xylocopilactobacillus apis]
MSAFAAYNFKPEILSAIENLGFKKPTKVQERIFFSALKKKNVIGMSETGSGKSHAFLLPIFNNLDFSSKQIQTVIISPSRELAEQLYSMAEALNKLLPEQAKIQLLIGGKEVSRLQTKIENNHPQIIIGTPGRTVELMNSLRANYSSFVSLVIDEADMSMDLGNAKDLNIILEGLPKDHQIMLFSATINQQLQVMIKKYLHGDVELKEVPNHKVINENVNNYLISTRSLSNEELIYRLITRKTEYLVFIFANTKKRVEEIYQFLSEKGLNIAQIHGDLPSRRRHQIMKKVLHLDYNFVVSTDLAARGIDIPGISLVVNDDIPDNLEYFIHRVGRTARMGQKGTAITLFHRDETKIKELEAKGIKFQEVRLSKGELLKIDRRNRRKKHQDQFSKNKHYDVVIPSRMRKIKPGYKHRIKSYGKRQMRKKGQSERA